MAAHDSSPYMPYDGVKIDRDGVVLARQHCTTFDGRIIAGVYAGVVAQRIISHLTLLAEVGACK